MTAWPDCTNVTPTGRSNSSHTTVGVRTDGDRRQAAGEDDEPHGEDREQHHRAEHPRRVPAAPAEQLHEVEHGEHDQGQGLQPDDACRHP